jgi:curved DNA-binding protein CbpA
VPRQPNYYRILGVALSADEAEIKRAYRALAKRYHPDRVPADRREWARVQMARINSAYEVLSDPLRRTQYDHQQRYASTGSPQAVPVLGGAIWRLQRTRERSRRRRIERRRAVALGSAAALGIALLAALIWFRWLGLDTSVGRCMWAIVLIVGLLMVLAAFRLTEL